jgi:hypothetical protein
MYRVGWKPSPSRSFKLTSRPGDQTLSEVRTGNEGKQTITGLDTVLTP